MENNDFELMKIITELADLLKVDFTETLECMKGVIISEEQAGDVLHYYINGQ